MKSSKEIEVGDAVGKSFPPVKRFDNWAQPNKRPSIPVKSSESPPIKTQAKQWNNFVYEIVLLFLLALVFFLFWNNNLKENPAKTNTDIEPEQIPEPEIEPLIVEGSKTGAIIENYQDKEVSVSVTYRVFSQRFGVDYEQTQKFKVEPSMHREFTVYDNAGCSTAPCSVSIINYKELG